MVINVCDENYLARCIELAEAALRDGNPPFGSILVGRDGTVLFADHNRTAGGDETRHPELTIAKWAAQNLGPVARAAATVYTSNEHCPMCAAAHAWVGLGRIVYAASSEQLGSWLAELNAPLPPVAMLPIGAVVPGLEVDGPSETFACKSRALHRRHHGA